MRKKRQSPQHGAQSWEFAVVATVFILVIGLCLDGAMAYRSHSMLSEATAALVNDRALHLSAADGLADRFQGLEDVCPGSPCADSPLKKCIEAVGKAYLKESYGLPTEELSLNSQLSESHDLSVTADLDFSCFFCKLFPLKLRATSSSPISGTCSR